MRCESFPNLRDLVKHFLDIEKVKSDKYGYTADEVEVYSFPQIWGSTALGFGGIGGQAMTSAQTTVVMDIGLKYAAVYFNNVLAYFIENPNETFIEDLYKHNMAACSQIGKYRG